MIHWAAQRFRSVTHIYWNLRAHIQFLIRGVAWPKNLTVKGPLGLSAPGIIVLGENITIVNDSKYNRAGINHPAQLVAAKGALLTIGNSVGVSGGSIFCVESITIWNHVLLGANSNAYDNDFHPVDHIKRRNNLPGASAPVVIEDDVWLCADVVVLKGVTIGARSVIAAGSVVTSDIPPDTLAGGSPAKPIRQLNVRKSVQNDAI